MTYNYTSIVNSNGDLNLSSLLKLIQIRKKMFFALNIIFIICSMLFLFTLPNKYTSSAKLVPTAPESGLNSSSLAGLASLGGISLGSQQDLSEEAMIRIKSLGFFESLNLVEDMSVPIIAAKGWDRAKNKIIINRKKYDANSGTWIRKPPAFRNQIPSVQEIHENFIKSLSLSKDRKSGVVTISVEHYSPYLAQKWLKNIIIMINKIMRDEDISRYQRLSDYLQKELETAEFIEVRSSISKVLERNIEKISFAKSSTDYVFKVMDPPTLPEKKSSPFRSLILIGLMVISLFISTLVIIFMNSKLKPST